MGPEAVRSSTSTRCSSTAHEPSSEDRSARDTRLVTVGKAKTFPKNVELEFEMPLGNGLRHLAYSVAEIPARSSYKPRLADDRVGYFTTSIKDLGDPAADT